MRRLFIFLMIFLCAGLIVPAPDASLARPARQSDREAGEPIGPGGGGRMSRVVFSPHEAGVLYAGNDMGGIFKSGDSGLSWAYLGRDFNGSSVLDIALHPTDPATLYVLSATGLDKSTDGGQTWQLLTARHAKDATPQRPFLLNLYGLNEDARRLNVLTIDPRNPDVLYISGYVGRDQPEAVNIQRQVIYRSADAGLTWQPLPGNPFPGLIRSIVIDPLDSDVLYVTGYHGFFKSVDQGASWVQMNEGLPDEPLPNARSIEQHLNGTPPDTVTGPDLFDLVIDPTDPAQLYVLTRSHGVYQSGDGGASWSAANGSGDAALNIQPYSGTFDFEFHGITMDTLVMDPANPARLIVALRPAGQLAESLDGGQTWHTLLNLYPPSMPAEVQPGFHHSEAQRAFMPCSFGDCGSPGIDIAINPANPLEIFTAQDMGLTRLLLDPDSRRVTTRQQITEGLLVITQWGMGPSVDTLDNGRVIYAAGMDTTMLRSTDGGQTWQSTVTEAVKQPGGRSSWFYGMSVVAVDTQPPTVFYCAAQEYVPGLYRSRDGGDTWQRLTEGIPQHTPFDGWGACNQVVLHPDYSQNQTLYVVLSGAGVFRSVDGGDTWQALNNGLPVDDLLSDHGLAIDPNQPEVLYLAPREPGYLVYRSQDGGQSWQGLEFPLAASGGPVAGLAAFDVNGVTHLLLSAHRGVLLSRDSGESWEIVLHVGHLVGPRAYEAWTWQMPFSLVVAPASNPARMFVTISGWGGVPRLPEHGIYTSDDGGQTWGKLYDAPNYGGNITVTDDGRTLIQFSGGMDLWRYDLPDDYSAVQPLPYPDLSAAQIETAPVTIPELNIQTRVPVTWRQTAPGVFEDYADLRLIFQAVPGGDPRAVIEALAAELNLYNLQAANSVEGWNLATGERPGIQFGALVRQQAGTVYVIALQAPHDSFDLLAEWVVRPALEGFQVME